MTIKSFLLGAALVVGASIAASGSTTAAPLRITPEGALVGSGAGASVVDVAYRKRRHVRQRHAVRPHRHYRRHRHYVRRYRYDPGAAIFGTVLGAIASGALADDYYYYPYDYYYPSWGYYPYGYGYPYPAYGYGYRVYPRYRGLHRVYRPGRFHRR